MTREQGTLGDLFGFHSGGEMKFLTTSLSIRFPCTSINDNDLHDAAIKGMLKSSGKFHLDFFWFNSGW